MRVLLDTGALQLAGALYVAGGVTDLAFTAKVQRLLEDPDTVRLVSPISFIEIPIKANNSVANQRRAFHGVFGLPAHHHDPFDRALMAIALAESVPIAARDCEFKKYKALRTIW